jgi:hypothetical protein
MTTRWSAALARARSRRALLRKYADVLQPGPWLLMHPKVAYHWRRRDLPAHVRQTKASARARRPGAIGALSAVLRAALSWTWVRRRPGGSVYQAYSILVPNAYSADVVLLDPPGRRVLRVAHDPAASRHRAAIQATMAAHLPVPAFRMADRGRLVHEEYIDGVSLAEVSPARRMEAFAKLLTGYAELCRSAGEGTSAPLIEAALRSAAIAALPAALHQLLEWEDARLRMEAAGWLLIPAHGDLCAENILVDAQGPRLIDFEWAGHLPFFYDVVTLLVREAVEGDRDDLLVAWLRRRPIGAVAELFAASGAFADARLVVLAGVILRAHLAATRDGAMNLARFERYVTRAWTVVGRKLV